MPSQEPPPSTDVPFPSPQTFSIIPSIHALLLRLQAGTSTNNVNETTQTTSFDAGAQQPPLLLKDLPSAAASIRLKISKAKATVDSLPDIERTIEEQEEEIKALEARVSRLRSTIGHVGTHNEGTRS